MLERDDELRAWLPTWKSDGGDARRFRRGARRAVRRRRTRECAAWRYSERLLTPLRLKIREVARALLVHPRHLPYAVVAAIADGGDDTWRRGSADGDDIGTGDCLGYCLAKPGAWQDEPWEGDVVVKVGSQDLRVPGLGVGGCGRGQVRREP